MAKNKSKIVQTHPVCIFCGGQPLTNEHLWPQWMKNLVPITETKYLHERSNSGSLARRTNEPETRFINRPVTSKQLKIVCETCNSGWMSRIENEARSILTQLILDQVDGISKVDYEIITKWAVLKTIIADYIRRDSPLGPSITSKERKLFFTTNEPPAEWMVWIGRIIPGTSYNFFRRAGLIGVGQADYKIIKHSFVSVIFSVGHLVIYTVKPVVSTNVPQYGIIGSLNEKMIKIFPQESIWQSIFGQEKKWKLVSTITLPEIDELSENVAFFMREANRRFSVI